ncbi:hypothetical protein F933_01151 [Acinetobacter beijerinckii CIP 110307]|uniref:Uncharacterized protein n=1 Tax=Acinetobacter beijerinckii CIP 110307 TaxID=1217648 RepID=N9FHB4_9GAMM|nr:hypothetical protein F933_01151 [Acinetobacter beijerinckii CIP 110307]
MNQAIERYSFWKHGTIAMGLLLLTAILDALIQNHYANDHLEILFFSLIAVLGFFCFLLCLFGYS